MSPKMNKIIFNVLNTVVWRRKCLFCQKLVDIDCNIIQYKVSEYREKIMSAYVCSKCSKKMFIEKQQAEIFQDDKETNYREQ